MIKSDSTQLRYRAHDKTHGWLSEISGYDANNSSSGYAGWFGYEIDAIMIKADDIVTTTVIEKSKEEVKQEAPVITETYRIRITWRDVKSQIGAYKNLDSAINICQAKTDETGIVYTVFNNAGEAVYVATVKVKESEQEKQEDNKLDTSPDIEVVVPKEDDKQPEPDIEDVIDSDETENDDNIILPDDSQNDEHNDDSDNSKDIPDDEYKDDNVNNDQKLFNIILKIIVKIVKKIFFKK
jgi:hypothetical protein